MRIACVILSVGMVGLGPVPTACGQPALPPPSLGQRTTVNGIAVIVNDQVITFKDVQRQIADQIDLLMAQYQNQPGVLEQKITALQRDTIEQLVERELILHQFETAGYTLPEDIINQVVEDRIKQRFGDRLTLTKTLHKTGSRFETFRQKIREDFIVEQMRLKNVSSEIIISPFKVEKYYQEHQEEFRKEDQVKLRMIVIEKGAPDGEAARRRAEEVLAKVKDGVPFTEMASVYSQGTQKGGDWGWVERSVLRKDLAEVAFSLEPGEVSDVIEKDEAIYLMLVEDQRAAHIQPLSKVRDEIEQTLKSQERDRLQDQWIDSLKKKSFIRYF